MRSTTTDFCAIVGQNFCDPVIVPFIEMASGIIDDLGGCAKNINPSILKCAESYLAIHLFSLSPSGVGVQQLKSEKNDTNSMTYNVSSVEGKGFLSTTFGQQADSMLNGCLSQKSKPLAKFGGFGGRL